MPLCPPNEQLTGLLEDRLSAAERDALARHIEGCIPCQEKLAGLTAAPDTETSLLANQPPPGSEDEEAMLRRLKQLPPSVDADRPTVPGYEVLEELGRGGMGVVYKARQLALQRTVALKMILTSAAGPEAVARFRAEAAVIASLQHPNIVQIHDIGEAAGRAYFALEYVAGGSLAQHLDGKPQPARLAAELLKTVARAVHAAHINGIIHRDLKPANILLQKCNPQMPQITQMKDKEETKTEEGRGKELDHLSVPHSSSVLSVASVSSVDHFFPKITDFGLAKSIDGDREWSGPRAPTVTGVVVGTPNYMAPEQAATPRRQVGPAADVYALGAILYELLTGRPPFLGESPLDTVLQLLHREPVSVTRLQPKVPRDLETICHKCLQKDPRKRYASALELAEDLHRFLAGQPIKARPPSALYQLVKFAQRNKALVAALAGVVLALLAGSITAAIFAVLATEQKNAALRQAYYARVAAASAALRDNDIAAAALHLELAPEARRDWEWRYLSCQLNESAAVIRAPDQREVLLASADEGTWLALVGPNDIRLLGLDGRQGPTLPCHGLRVLHVEHAPRSTLAFGKDEAGHLVILDNAGQVRLRLDPPPELSPDVVAVSPDRTRLAVNWRQNDPPHSFVLYELPSGNKLATCAGHAGYVFALAFSPDGRQIASASEDHTARLWDAATGAARGELGRHDDKVLAIAYLPKAGGRALTASADGTVRQWDTATRQPLGPPYRGHRHDVNAAVYSQDGRWIASGDRDGIVRLWSATDQQDIGALHGHTEGVLQLAFSPDGRRLASIARDRTARTWEVGTEPSPLLLRGHESYVYPVAYSPDGQWIASGSWDHTVRLWDARTGRPCVSLPHPGNVRALAFSPDGSWLVCGCEGQTQLQIWDVATGRPRKQVPAPGDAVQAITVSSDGGRIAAADRGGHVGIVDVATGEEVASLRMSGEWADKKALAYSPDGRRLAGTGEDSKNIAIWDTQNDTQLAQLVGHTAAVYSVAFSRDGAKLVSASHDKTVRIWDVGSGGSTILPGHTDHVFAAVFHPDGRRVASAGRDRAILLWDVATGVEVVRLQGHTSYVFSLAFSPDGATLASGSGDRTIRLWDTVPLADRLAARREAEAQRPQAEKLIGRLLEELKEPSRVARAVWQGQDLSPSLRRAAQQELWRRLGAAK
jgi:WD40 repeat protein/serine/threonine protein kinase